MILLSNFRKFVAQFKLFFNTNNGMNLVDSHAHIYLEHFKDDQDEVINRALEIGVEAIFMPNIDHPSIEDMLKLADKYPGYCFPMMGLHPSSVDKNFEKSLYEVENWLSKETFVAVGEMGTDLYWDKTFWPQQQEAFKIQIELAKKHELPFVIHCRESIDETIALIEPLNTIDLKGVFHCFSGNLDQAQRIVDMGFLLGIGGVATFKNGGLAPVIQGIDLDHVIIETDSPYLAPVPFRGKRNEPAYVELVANKIAELKNLEAEEVANVTSATAQQLFHQN